MNLFELFVKIGVDDQASEKMEKISDKIGKGLKKAAAIFLFSNKILAICMALEKAFSIYLSSPIPSSHLNANWLL